MGKEGSRNPREKFPAQGGAASHIQPGPPEMKETKKKKKKKKGKKKEQKKKKKKEIVTPSKTTDGRTQKIGKVE